MRYSTPLVGSALAAAAFALWTAGEAFAMTEGKTAQGLAYVSGGIALGGREALERRRSEFKLRMVTAANKTGSYLADARVSITGQTGATVLDTTLDGRWRLVDLKLGRYTVEASLREHSWRKSTTIHKGERREMLFYPDLEAPTLRRSAKD